MSRIQRNLLFVGCLLLAALTAGCYDTKDEYTLNPDGSGKVVHECAYHEITLNQGAENEDPDETLRKSVSQFISEAKGVEAWSDVSYRIQDDGRMYFRGTAYFKNLSKLDLGNQQFLKFDWNWNNLGTSTLSLRNSPTKPSSPPTGTNASRKLRDDLFHFQQIKPLLTLMLGDLNDDAIFHVPGRVSSSTLQRSQDGSVSMNFSGARLLSLINEKVKDTNWLATHANLISSATSSQPEFGEELQGELFGGKAPFAAKIDAGAKPLFDYAAEVAAASKQSVGLQAELQMAPAATPVASTSLSGAGLSNVRVAGIRIVSAEKAKSGLQAFNSQPGYSLAIFADLSAGVHAFTDKCELETAVADNGEDLLPERAWDRRLQFPQLSQDKASVAFEANLKLPSSSAKTLKEISGHLEYSMVAGTKDVDLGITELTDHAKGTNLGAVIDSIKDGMIENSEREMDLKLNLKPDSLKELDLVVDGVRTPLSSSGYAGFNDSYTFTFGSKNPFPAKGALVAVIYDNVKTVQVPFKLENLSLVNVGGPLSR